jgi:hypothetical protein
MASEDSQNLGWFPMIHCLSDLRDLDYAGHRQMPAEFHQLDDLAELLEVVPFEVRSGYRRKNGTIFVRRSSNR